MPKPAVAEFNGTVVAESDKAEEVDGVTYFPPESVKTEYIKSSAMQTISPTKGKAKYSSLQVSGETASHVVYQWSEPSDATKAVAGYYAFEEKKGVKVKGK